jgi:hypothetical protein
MLNSFIPPNRSLIFFFLFASSSLMSTSLHLVEPLPPVGVEGTLISPFIYSWGMWWCSWLRHCTTSHKVTVSIPDGVIRPGVGSASNRNEY